MAKYEYKESDAVRAAREALEKQNAMKPQAYQSQWTQQLNDVMNKIQNREPFKYDLNGDALFQQYKDNYVRMGKNAMMDTMGQATALTGGYGNSYATAAGSQAYHNYLQELNNIAPQLQQLALDTYNRGTQDLYNQYNLYGDQEAMDYNRYRDTLGDYESERAYLENNYNNLYESDYNRYMDALNLQYQQERDAVADAQWQKEFDLALQQYNDSKNAKSSGGGGGGSNSGGTPKDNDSGDYFDDATAADKVFAGAKKTASWENYVAGNVRRGVISQADGEKVLELLREYFGTRQNVVKKS